jgi:hypothetical protein
MSLTAFKRKSVIQYGSKRSAKGPGGYWLPQGPFGGSLVALKNGVSQYGPVGFSINGPHRNVGYIGKESRVSKNGTPYKGAYAVGWGGTSGTYPTTQPVLNVNRVLALGDQWQYVKPSVLSTKGMLEKRYRWINNGQFPNYWVQPVYTGNQTDTKSQGLYTHTVTTSNQCVVGVNDAPIYVGNIKQGGATLCYTTTARFRGYNTMAAAGLYTKNLGQPQDSSQHTLYVQRGCTNPVGPQKPYPYATNGATCNGTGPEVVNMTPPAWYTKGTVVDSGNTLVQGINVVGSGQFI